MDFNCCLMGYEYMYMIRFIRIWIYVVKIEEFFKKFLKVYIK